MSAIRLKLPAIAKTAQLINRMPKPVLVWAQTVLCALTLAAALLARRIPPFDLKLALGALGICLAGVVVSRWHLRVFPTKGVEPAIAERIVWFSGLLTVFGLQIGAQAIGASPSPSHEVSPLAAAPLVSLGMLVSGLLGPAKGIFTVGMVAAAAVGAGIADPPLVAGATLAAWIGAHAVNPMRQRNDLFRATYVTSLAYAAMAMVTALLVGRTWAESFWFAGWGLAGGVGATALFWLAVAAFEKAFGVVSDWSLLEHCNPDQPLLRKLMIQAPGTYAHSVMVGNLADQAAPLIGANALLCRAMAYYHDIGKMRRPEFFIENKLADNPHDRLNPTLSAKIIAAHVRDGLKMADEAGLPNAIKAGIAEHHGTSLISYFYHLHSQETGVSDPILELHFRYPGPRPHSKETAVLMLADRVEAATRTMPSASPGRLRALVWEIVQDVRDDGQLDDSALNFRDLQTIVDSFVNSLTALRHERIDYPGSSLEGLDEETSYTDRQSFDAPSENLSDQKSLNRDA